METFALSILIPIAYLLIIISIITIVFFAIKRMGVNIKRTKRTLLGIAGLIIFVLIGYTIGNGSNQYLDSFGITPNQEKWIDTGLFILYTIGFIGVTSIVFTEIKTALKK